MNSKHSNLTGSGVRVSVVCWTADRPFRNFPNLAANAYERMEAETAVRTLDDVVGVKSLIKTRTSAVPDQVEDTLACSESDAGAIYLPVATIGLQPTGHTLQTQAAS